MAFLGVVSGASGVFWSLELGFSLTMESGRKKNWHARNFPYSRAPKMKRLFCKLLVLWWFRPLQGSSGVWNWAFP